MNELYFHALKIPLFEVYKSHFAIYVSGSSSWIPYILLFLSPSLLIPQPKIECTVRIFFLKLLNK